MAYLLSKSVFVHTPKTAGQWVASALENSGLITGKLGVVHSSPDEIRQQSEYQKRDFVFTFVRHPLSWYQSMWSHRMDESWEPIDDPDWFTNKWIERWAEFTDRCCSSQFDEFVRKCIESFPEGFVSSLYADYTNDCTFVGKQESISEDLVFALTQSGEIFEPGRLLDTRPKNVRGTKPYRRRTCIYTSDLIELVMKAECKTIEKYGYSDIPSTVLMENLP